MFTFKQVEGAVLSLHNVPYERWPAYHARVRHFQKLGLIPSGPGRGVRREYSIFDAVKWALCFEFAELGVGPELLENLLILPLVSFSGTLREADAKVRREPQIFWMRGEFLSKYLARDNSYSHIPHGVLPASRVAPIVLGADDFGRVLLLDLSKLKRDLGAALNINWEANPKAIYSSFREALESSIPWLTGPPPISVATASGIFGEAPPPYPAAHAASIHVAPHVAGSSRKKPKPK